MSMRRPRVKAAANLMNIKRKKPLEKDDIKPPKVVKCEKDEDFSEKQETVSKPASPEVAEPARVPESVTEAVPVKDSPVEQTVEAVEVAEKVAEEVVEKVAEEVAAEEEHDSFKCPPRVEYNRIISQNAPATVTTNDDVFHSDLESDVIQRDLQKSFNDYPMSPSKLQSRQRIRATPIFGQRRNSFVSSSPSPHTEEASADFAVPSTRRERHTSSSQSQAGSTPTAAGQSGAQHYHTPHKYMPSMGGVGRIRTESGCSAFSDTYAMSTTTSKRKNEDSQRVSSRRDFEARFNKGVPERSNLKMFDLIYYNPHTNPMATATIKKKEFKVEPEDSKADIKPLPLETKSTAMPVPQLKLNANGELILDDKSLEIETTAEQEARKVLAKSSLVYLDENTGMNGFYKRKKRTKEWPPEETVKFYRCLQTVGTDFSLMCPLFPQRTRRDLKLKFKKEERCNDNLISKALLYPKTFNVDDLRLQLKEEEDEREDAERRWKSLKAGTAKITKKINTASSVAERTMTNGDDVYRNEHLPRNKLSSRARGNTTITALEANCKDAEMSPMEPTFVTAKRQRQRQKRPNPLSPTHVSQELPTDVEIKTEHTIKTEMPSTRNNTTEQPVQQFEANELEQEMTELLRAEDAPDSTLPPLPTTVQVLQIDDTGKVSTLLPPTELALLDDQKFGTFDKTLPDLDSIVSYSPEVDMSEVIDVKDAAAFNLIEVRAPQDTDAIPSTSQQAAARAIKLQQSDVIATTSQQAIVIDPDSIPSTSQQAAARRAAEQAAARAIQLQQAPIIDPDSIPSTSRQAAALATAITEADIADEVASLLAEEETEPNYYGRQLDADDIQQILNELATGALVLVSTLDEAHEDPMVNEIYRMNQATGELMEEPLGLAAEIVNRIKAVMCGDDDPLDELS